MSVGVEQLQIEDIQEGSTEHEHDPHQYLIGFQFEERHQCIV